MSFPDHNLTSTALRELAESSNISLVIKSGYIFILRLFKFRKLRAGAEVSGGEAREALWQPTDSISRMPML
jgi:hypothetical protein